ncbi:MAG: DUF1015 domain-containing protein [SAR202 cluster bacterium]|nr:DUF1015 domain-containing protein [SAR202 cluster bacterium]
MAEVRPFSGIRYDAAKAGSISHVLCPPYDIISVQQERSFLEHSPYSAVALELRELKPGEPADPGRYQASAERLRAWLREGTLRQDDAPSMYLLEERFEHRGATRTRRTLLAAVGLEPFEKGVVMPHEHTRPGPKADRLALMKAAHANLSPIMALYRDGDVAEALAQTQKTKSAVEAALEGTAEYRLWRIADRTVLERIGRAMAARQLFIADGHHRYETALKYRDDLVAASGPLPPDAAANFMMIGLIAMDDQGLLVQPYHRVLGGLTRDEMTALRSGLARAYEVSEIPLASSSAEASANRLEASLRQAKAGSVVAAAYGLEPGKAHLLTLRESEMPKLGSPPLDRAEMRILHRKGITPSLGADREAATIAFVHDAVEAVERVTEGKSQVALLLRALPMDLFVEVVSRGERLPPKSTYFYPKLPTGLVFRSLEGTL